ncbi:MAG: hypothetical protein A4E42_01318 [Methanoregulaceae archaeon PtaU1.Bin222]|nr:MAG: hypothetical protein A4E42_01318 [Methanoregulaceae archaeon PtaU1.Bin222]
MMPKIMKNMTMGVSFWPYSLSCIICSVATWSITESSDPATSEPEPREFASWVHMRTNALEGFVWAASLNATESGTPRLTFSTILSSLIATSITSPFILREGSITNPFFIRISAMLVLQ